MAFLNRALKRYYNSLYNRFNRDFMYRQIIPLQVLYRSSLEYDVELFGHDEFYIPREGAAKAFQDFPVLANNLKPQAIPRPYHFTVPDAVISVFDVYDPRQSDRIFLENYPEPTLWPERNNHIFQPARRSTALRHAKKNSEADFEKGYLFSNSSWRFYYHLLMDSCLRYIDLEGVGAIDANTVIFVHEKPGTIQREYMEMLGIEADKIVVSHPRRYKVKEFVIASPRRERFACSPAAMAQLKQKAFDRFSICPSSSRSRLYISRKDARIRRVMNEDALESMLLRRGFTICTLEGLSLVEQIKLFSEAGTIVAPHGGGLSNIIYSDQPTLVELQPGDRWEFGYFIPPTLSLNGRYFPFRCETSGKELEMKVNIDSLARLLDSLLEEEDRRLT